VRLNALSVDENKVRHGFLQFFDAILKNYRKFLVYATKERPNPRSVFRNEDFLREHPEDWQPFISKVIKSRAFSHFVHERMGSALYGVVRDSNYSDIIFFEESIDSKMRSSLDTPLLSHTSDNYIKFFVPSPPDSDGLQSSSYSYTRYPCINVDLLANPREGNVNSDFEASARAQALAVAAAANRARLKRAESVSQSNPSSMLSCHFSCFLTVLSDCILRADRAVDIMLDESALQCSYSELVMETSSHLVALEDEENKSNVAIKYYDAARLALKVGIEVLNCLTKMNDAPDGITFRYLVNACADCGESCSAVELIALICALGYEPDTALISSVAASASKDTSDNHVNPEDVWTTQDWRALHLKLQKKKINDVRVLVPHGEGVLNSALRIGYGISTLPNLQWSGFSKIDRTNVYSVSSRLIRHMINAENLLGNLFPDLEIDFNHPCGASCPNPKCCKSQSIAHIFGGFSRDPNAYTSKCYSCGHLYVPRFTVQCSSLLWEGSEKIGPGSILWCEFLSPWVLRKEVLIMLFDGGVKELIPTSGLKNLSFRNPVVFWNMVISFRLLGLPYSRILTPLIDEAFQRRT
jgi:dDENN domain